MEVKSNCLGWSWKEPHHDETLPTLPLQVPAGM